MCSACTTQKTAGVWYGSHLMDSRRQVPAKPAGQQGCTVACSRVDCLNPRRRGVHHLLDTSSMHRGFWPGHLLFSFGTV